MTNPPVPEPIILDEKGRIAVHAARDAAYAVELARQVQAQELAKQATDVAAEIASQKTVDEKRMAQIMREQVEHVLAMGTEQEKTMILARVKYVCQDIKEMKQILKEIMEQNEQLRVQLEQRSKELALLQQQSALANKIVFGFVALIVIGFMGAVSMLVFR